MKAVEEMAAKHRPSWTPPAGDDGPARLQAVQAVQAERMTDPLVDTGRTAWKPHARTMGWSTRDEPEWVQAATAVADVLVREPIDRFVSVPWLAPCRRGFRSHEARHSTSSTPVRGASGGRWKADGERDRRAVAGALAAMAVGSPHPRRGRAETLTELNTRGAGALDDLVAA